MNKPCCKWILPVLIVAFLVVLSGCSPQKKPTPAQPAPAPQSQNVQGSEPEITVFMHETNEKKTMKMEEYIAGVVAGEMKSDWPVEALAAQAIIARTFTLEAMESKGGVPARGTQASTDIKEFQAYNAKDVNDNVKKAVEMTRGQVIVYQGKLAKTWFHASAGGMTASAKEGLNYKEAEPPYIKPVQSPDELAPKDVQNWTVSFPMDKVMAAVEKAGLQMITWLGLPLVAIGGWFYPLLGFLLLICMLGSVGIAAFRGRAWCDWMCPRGSFLDLFVGPISLNRKIPGFLRNKYTRGFMVALIFTVMGTQWYFA